MSPINVRRGDIFWVDLSGGKGAEINHKIRPALVIQNDVGNQYSPTTIVAPLSGTISRRLFPTEVRLIPSDILAGKGETGLLKTSTVKLEQIRTVDKRRLRTRIGRVTPKKMLDVDKAIRISLNI